MSVVTSDQSKLVLNAFAATFQNNLVSADLFTWKQYDGEFDPRNRLNVSEQVGPRYAVRKNTDAVADLTTGLQASVFGSEQFKVDTIYTVDMAFADFAKVRDLGSARESEAIKNAATNLAEQIDADGMRACGFASNNWVGTPGNNVASYNDFASGVTRLMEEGVEMMDLRAALAPADRQALGTTVIAQPSTDAMATSAFRNGFKGLIDDVPTMFTQQLGALTTGSRTATATILVNGAAQNVNYADVAISSAPGRYMSQTLICDGATTQTFVAGDVFTIAGVFAYDNRKQASLGRLQQFTVIEAATGVAGAVTLRVFPAMIVPGSGSGNNIRINTAHATVTAAPADNAVLTFVGAASTTFIPRFIIQKQAIVANTVALAMPDSDTSMRRSLSKVPLSVRMWKWSDGLTGQHNVRFDVAVNFNVRDRRRIVRINGA
jgi:P22 coat protein - gene protein 5